MSFRKTYNIKIRKLVLYVANPGVGLALWCFVVCSAGRFVVCLALCRFVLVFFGPFGVAVVSLREGGGAGEGEGLVLVLFVCLVGLCLFGFVGFLFLLVSEKSCGLFSLTFFCDCGTLWTFLLPFFFYFVCS